MIKEHCEDLTNCTLSTSKDWKYWWRRFGDVMDKPDYNPEEIAESFKYLMEQFLAQKVTFGHVTLGDKETVLCIIARGNTYHAIAMQNAFKKADKEYKEIERVNSNGHEHQYIEQDDKMVCKIKYCREFYLKSL